jgi:hypothetical protein
MDFRKIASDPIRQSCRGGFVRAPGEVTMGRRHGHGPIRKKKVKGSFPLIHVDADLDFASIKLAPGVEARSYQRDGFVFCEDKKGKIIEIQVLNLSELKNLKGDSAA